MLHLTETARKEINRVKATLVRTIPLQIWSQGLLAEFYEAFLARINWQLVINRAEVGSIPQVDIWSSRLPHRWRIFEHIKLRSLLLVFNEAKIKHRVSFFLLRWKISAYHCSSSPFWHTHTTYITVRKHGCLLVLLKKIRHFGIIRWLQFLLLYSLHVVLDALKVN